MRIAFLVANDMNLGVGYIVTYLKKRGDEVKVFLDPRINDGRYYVDRIKDYRSNIVGISCITSNYTWARNMALDLVGTTVVFGGVHATLSPEDFKGLNICQGDGIAYFGGEFDYTAFPEREDFLRQLPPIHRKVQMVMTGFGCPFKCSFCYNHQLQKKIIRRHPDNCIDELKSMKGLRYVLFNDDIFTINKKWLLQFLPKYRKKIHLPFTCFGHAKYIDKDICSLLKHAGCKMVWLGIQSGDEWVRKNILNRHETNYEIVKACRTIKDAGLKLMIDHIFGVPQDNVAKSSYNFYRKLRPDVVNCYELLYFPKAEINKFGGSCALTQNEGGEQYKRYSKQFCSIPLMADKGTCIP